MAAFRRHPANLAGLALSCLLIVAGTVPAAAGDLPRVLMRFPVHGQWPDNEVPHDADTAPTTRWWNGSIFAEEECEEGCSEFLVNRFAYPAGAGTEARTLFIPVGLWFQAQRFGPISDHERERAIGAYLNLLRQSDREYRVQRGLGSQLDSEPQALFPDEFYATIPVGQSPLSALEANFGDHP